MCERKKVLQKFVRMKQPHISTRVRVKATADNRCLLSVNLSAIDCRPVVALSDVNLLWQQEDAKKHLVGLAFDSAAKLGKNNLKVAEAHLNKLTQVVFQR